MSAHDLIKKAIEGCFIVFIVLGMVYSAVLWHWSIPVLFCVKLVIWIRADLQRKRMEAEEEDETDDEPIDQVSPCRPCMKCGDTKTRSAYISQEGRCCQNCAADAT